METVLQDPITRTFKRSRDLGEVKTKVNAALELCPHALPTLALAGARQPRALSASMPDPTARASQAIPGFPAPPLGHPQGPPPPPQLLLPA